MAAGRRDPPAVGIHSHFIGAFIALRRKDIPEAAILMQTRKGVAVRYSPQQIAC